MHRNQYQSKNEDSSSRLTNSVSSQSQKENIEKAINSAIENLDPEDALRFLESFKQNNHSVFCHRAQLCAKIQDYNLAFEMCQKAFQLPPLCTKCISLYIQIYEKLLPRKLPFLDFLLSKFDSQQIADSKIEVTLRKIKQTQHLDQGYQDFLTDLFDGGAEFSKLSIKSENSDNRTVITKAYVQKDQILLFIPQDKLILLQKAKDSLVVRKILEQKLYLKSPKHCQLTILLLEQSEKGKKSAFWSYLNHFPKNFDNFPIYYKPEELEYLKGSPFLTQVQQKIKDIRQDYDSICSICPNFSKYNYEDFKKFRLIVSSRLFGIVYNKIRTDALVPLADMLNHHIPKQTSWFYSDQHQGFVVKSLTKIEKGQQIYDSYGQKCNSRFLLNYGFTIPDNDVNQVAIRIPFQYEEQQKVQIYKQVTLKVSKNIESKQFDELVSILRYTVSPQSEQSVQQSLDTIKQTPFTNLDIEILLWQKLQKIVEGQLADYPTSLKQDRKLLTQKDLTTNHMNCIILRKGEKQILHFYLVMARKMIKYLRGNPSIKGIEQFKQYESYLRQLNFS